QRSTTTSRLSVDHSRWLAVSVVTILLVARSYPPDEMLYDIHTVRVAGVGNLARPLRVHYGIALRKHSYSNGRSSDITALLRSSFRFVTCRSCKGAIAEMTRPYLPRVVHKGEEARVQRTEDCRPHDPDVHRDRDRGGAVGPPFAGRSDRPRVRSASQLS